MILHFGGFSFTLFLLLPYGHSMFSLGLPRPWVGT